MKAWFTKTSVVIIACAVFATACSSTDSSSSTESLDDVVASTDAEDTTTTTTTEAPGTTASETTSTAAPALVDGIDWTLCGDMECGTVAVPLDYRDAGGDTISIAVNRLSAADTDRRRGVLLVNPGGPGASGLDFAASFASGFWPSQLTDNFDIIGFDPRGVGQSEPFFACGESGDQIDVLSPIEELIDTPEEIEAVEAAVDLCIDSMGDAAGLIHTGYVARDMDQIRAALGEDQITYLGFSYGSIIGVWYATLFPDRVRAMVIDGADNPIDDFSDFEAQLESAREQAGPLHDLLEEALNACADASCPIYNDGNPIDYYIDATAKFDLIDEAMANNPDAGFLGLITPLYNEAAWPGLWAGLAALEEQDDPSIFVDFAEFQLGTDPGAVNITGYINCLDGWALQPEFDREARLQSDQDFFAIEDQLDEEFPLFAVLDDGLASTCSFMDILDTPALEGPFDGSDVPILVVGNTSDPVTSFGESEEFVTEVLSNGILVKVDHPSHTVYPDNLCVNDAVHAALLDAVYPDTTIECGFEAPNVISDLTQACVEVAPSFVGEGAFTTDELLDLCSDFADASVARLGEDVALAALTGEDEEGGAVLFEILEQTFAAAGG